MKGIIFILLYLYPMIRIPALVVVDLNVSVAQDQLMLSTGFSLMQQISQQRHFVSGKYMRTNDIVDYPKKIVNIHRKNTHPVFYG